MKLKISKKVVSSVLAVMMVATSIPSFAASSYAADIDNATKQYVLEHIDSASKTYSDATAASVSNTGDNMKGILYTTGWGDSTYSTNDHVSTDSTKTVHLTKVDGLAIGVALYTGEDSDIRFPLMLESDCTDEQSNTNNYCGFDHVSFNNGAFAVGGATWQRCTNWDDLSAVTTEAEQTHNFSSDSTANVERAEKTADSRFEIKNNRKYWSNYMSYTGTGNSDTYYDVVTNPTFDVQADYTTSWSIMGFQNWANNSNSTFTTAGNNQQFYVLNYAPLKNLLESDEFKSNFNDVVNNEWKYDVDSLNAYYAMYKDMIDFDLASQDYSSEENIAAVATKIKNFVNNYSAEPTVKKEFTVTFNMGDGSTVEKTITAGDTLASVIPTNTATKDNNNGTHTEYSWPSDCTSSTIPQSNVTYTETATTSECKYEVKNVDDVVVSTCTVCGHKNEVALNTTEYDAAYATATEAVNNTTKYTEETRNALQTVLDANKKSNALSQDELDEMTANINAAIADLRENLDTTDYDKAVADAKADIASGKYTDETAKALQEVLDNNKAENAKTQDELDQMTKNINDAIADLRENLDTTDYDKAVADAKADIASGKYTDETAKALQEVLDNNKSENAKTQDELDQMTKNINDAIADLREILDTTAYDAAVKVATDAINNTSKYTAESREALQAVLDANKVENAKTQDELDQMTRNIQNAVTNLVLRVYTVRMFYVIDDEVSEVQETVTGNYGEDFSLTCTLDNTHCIKKWVKSANDDEQKVGDTANAIGGRFYTDADYYVYATKAKSNQEGSIVVSLKDKSGKVVDSMYAGLTAGVANLNITFDIANKTVKVNDSTLAAMDLTFYNIVGFKVNGVEYTSNDSISLDANGNVSIETIYENAKSFAITSPDSSCTPSVQTAYWNQKVTVTSANATDSTKWYVNDKYVASGASYTFYACNNVEITCKNDSTADKATATVERLSYNDPTEKTITVVGSFYVPADCEVVEKGVLLKTTSVNKIEQVKDINNFTGSNANARKFVATNYDVQTNQYVINVYSKKQYTDLCVGAVAYVVYKDASGVEHTAYSDLEEFSQTN